MFKSVTVLLVLAGGLVLTACGDPSESVPTQPDQGGVGIEIDIDGKTRTKTATVYVTPTPKMPVPSMNKPPVTIPKYVPATTKKTTAKRTP